MRLQQYYKSGRNKFIFNYSKKDEYIRAAWYRWRVRCPIATWHLSDEYSVERKWEGEAVFFWCFLVNQFHKFLPLRNALEVRQINSFFLLWYQHFYLTQIFFTIQLICSISSYNDINRNIPFFLWVDIN